MNNNIEMEMQIRKLSDEQKQITDKVSILHSMYYELLELIEKTDGDLNKLPASIKKYGELLDSLYGECLRILPSVFDDKSIKLGYFNASSCKMTYEMLNSKYSPLINDLIELYKKKFEAKTMMHSADSVHTSNSNENMMNVPNDENNKMKIMQMLGNFNIYGTTDEMAIKIMKSNGSKSVINFDDRAKACIHNLNELINIVIPSELTNEDVNIIENFLSRMSMISFLSEEARNSIYDEIEEYISNLSSRRQRGAK